MTRQNAYRWLCRAAILVLLPLVPFAAAGAEGPVPLIFDTDMGNDVDDALALGLIHAFQRRGDCRLIAVTLATTTPTPRRLSTW